MKSCTIYKTNKNYIIVTQSICDIGARITDDPIYVIPVETNIEELREKVFDSLNNSRTDVYTPKRDEWSLFEKRDLEKMGQKSFITLYKNSNSCNLALENDILTIQPDQYCEPNKPKSGLCSVKEAAIQINLINTDKTEIMKILIEMLSVSYK